MSTTSRTDELTTADDGELPLFDDDRGVLPAAARRAMVLLIKRTHLWAATHPQEWQALTDYCDDICEILNELFLVVSIDASLGVAWAQQAVVDETVTSYTLLRSPRLTIVQARILLELHRRLADAQIQGLPAAVVRGGEILDVLEGQYPEDNGDHRAQRRYDKNQLAALAKDDILVAPHGSGSDDVEDIVYTISPIVAAILTPDRLDEYAATIHHEVDRMEQDGPQPMEPIDLEDDQADEAPEDSSESRSSLLDEEDQQ